MKKRFIAILLCIVLSMSMLFACSKSDSSDDKAGSNTVSTDVKNEQSSEPAKQETVKNDAQPAPENNNSVSDAAGTTAETSDAEDASNQGGEDIDSAENALKSMGLEVVTEVTDGITCADGVVTVVKGGAYTFTGKADEGRIVVNTPGEEVELAFAGASISSVKDSVIFVEDAEEVTIKAVNDTVNYLNDLRPLQKSDEDAAGSACIYSKDDLKFQGKGTLVVTATYNNGIQSKNDIKIKNLTLEVTAPNNAVKGNDSITIESGSLKITSTDGDGLKTKNTDLSSKGKQRGIIAITGGIVDIYAAKDCIRAAYELQIDKSNATVSEHKY